MPWCGLTPGDTEPCLSGRVPARESDTLPALALPSCQPEQDDFPRLPDRCRNPCGKGRVRCFAGPGPSGQIGQLGRFGAFEARTDTPPEAPGRTQGGGAMRGLRFCTNPLSSCTSHSSDSAIAQGNSAGAAPTKGRQDRRPAWRACPDPSFWLPGNKRHLGNAMHREPPPIHAHDLRREEPKPPPAPSATRSTPQSESSWKRESRPELIAIRWPT